MNVYEKKKRRKKKSSAMRARSITHTELTKKKKIIFNGMRDESQSQHDIFGVDFMSIELNFQFASNHKVLFKIYPTKPTVEDKKRYISEREERERVREKG